MNHPTRPQRPQRIGLTGGIGSGKSSVAEQFRTLGVPVIDTDAIAAELVQPGQPGLQRVADLFGSEILKRDGTLDRHRLRRLVFADPAQRHRLEQALHPLIRSEMRRRIEQLDAPYCILEIPLLLESGWNGEVDRILVVDTPQQLQIERAARRDNISREEVKQVIEAQSGREERLAAADDIISNDGDLEQLQRRVEQLHRFYLQHAVPKRPETTI